MWKSCVFFAMATAVKSTQKEKEKKEKETWLMWESIEGFSFSRTHSHTGLKKLFCTHLTYRLEAEIVQVFLGINILTIGAGAIAAILEV